MSKPFEQRQRNREHDARRRKEKPWRHLYKTPQWQALRLRVFKRDGYRCRLCGDLIVSGSVADHIKPHMGDAALFFDEDNVQTLHKHCHDGDKQRIDHGGKSKPTIGIDGWPV